MLKQLRSPSGQTSEAIAITFFMLLATFRMFTAFGFIYRHSFYSSHDGKKQNGILLTAPSYVQLPSAGEVKVYRDVLKGGSRKLLGFCWGVPAI